MTPSSQAKPVGPSDDVPAAAPDDLLVVSNRQPYRHRYEDGDVTVDRPTGGLVAGLDPVLQRAEGTWLAWGDGDADRAVSDDDDTVAVPPDDPSYTLARVWLSEAAVEGYYYGYSNRALWPLLHTQTGRATYEESEWEAYRSVNEQFADAVVERADAGTTVWFQDYHFALAPRLVSEATDATCAQFWHVPWPASDVFRTCPQAVPLLRGLLGNDLLSFHVPRYAEHFRETVEAILPEVSTTDDAIYHDGGTTRLHTAPMGVDAEAIREQSRATDDAAWRSFCADHGLNFRRPVAIGVDRLDYTKGIPERLEALEHLWETTPSMRGAFSFIEKGTESRGEIPAYRRLQERVEETVDRVNDRFGTDDWQPVVYTTEHLSRRELCGLYRHGDVLLVSPLRDGMNLVAQEYVAAQVEDDGVLVLSSFAGAHDELGDEALVVNPRDTPAYARTIAEALQMPEAERRGRMRRLRERVHEHDISAWLDEQFRAIEAIGGDER